jgi:N-acetylmuramic acid 6-phosphate etherase
VWGLIAGGDQAIRRAVEHSEDNMEAGFSQLKEQHISDRDFVIGLSASGYTPYVIGAMQQCASNGIKTGCVTCNPQTPLAAEVLFPVEVIVGPEFITGSTRMKSGTATKMVLNMISTSLMIKLGHVKDNKMVDMRPVNNKLLDRGARIIASQAGISYDSAYQLLQKTGSVRKVLDDLHQNG